jgi:hypothetical protein
VVIAVSIKRTDESIKRLKIYYLMELLPTLGLRAAVVEKYSAGTKDELEVRDRPKSYIKFHIHHNPGSRNCPFISIKVDCTAESASVAHY